MLLTTNPIIRTEISERLGEFFEGYVEREEGETYQPIPVNERFLTGMMATPHFLLYSYRSGNTYRFNFIYVEYPPKGWIETINSESVEFCCGKARYEMFFRPFFLVSTTPRLDMWSALHEALNHAMADTRNIYVRGCTDYAGFDSCCHAHFLGGLYNVATAERSSRATDEAARYEVCSDEYMQLAYARYPVPEKKFKLGDFAAIQLVRSITFDEHTDESNLKSKVIGTLLRDPELVEQPRDTTTAENKAAFEVCWSDACTSFPYSVQYYREGEFSNVKVVHRSSHFSHYIRMMDKYRAIHTTVY